MIRIWILHITVHLTKYQACNGSDDDADDNGITLQEYGTSTIFVTMQYKQQYCISLGREGFKVMKRKVVDDAHHCMKKTTKCRSPNQHSPVRQ